MNAVIKHQAECIAFPGPKARPDNSDAWSLFYTYGPGRNV